MDDYVINYSGEQLDEAIGKALDPDEMPMPDSDALITSGAVHAALGGKQNTLIFDDYPTPNSSNPVRSGGLKEVIDAKYTKPSGGIPASDLASDVLPDAYASNPVMDGVANPGSSASYARGDHVHPSDTSKSGKAYPFYITLSASSWVNKSQTVNNNLFLASGYIYHVTYDQRTEVNIQAYLSSNIYADNVTTNGSMVFHCMSVPTADITVKIARVEAQT